MKLVETIIPLLITRDDIGGYVGVNSYLNARFEEILGHPRYRKTITPCVCVCGDTIEKLTPYFSDHSLAEILSVRMRRDKTLRAPFFSPVRDYLRKKGLDRVPTLLRDAAFMLKEVAQKAFGVTVGI